jgi:hypothetical protein
MKPLADLINRTEPAWPLLEQWIAEATNRVEILPPIDDATRSEALYQTQVTTRSPMGSIVYETGGLLIDGGWLRILGSGHPRLPRSLPAWNRPRTYRKDGRPPPFLLIGDDVVGGFFAIDGGGLQKDPGKVCYFGPDTLEWESTKKGYGDFLYFCFRGDLAKFYGNLRWPGWELEVARLPGDQAIQVYPPPSAKGPSFDLRHRAPVHIAQMYRFHVDANAVGDA